MLSSKLSKIILLSMFGVLFFIPFELCLGTLFSLIVQSILGESIFSTIFYCISMLPITFMYMNWLIKSIEKAFIEFGVFKNKA